MRRAQFKKLAAAGFITLFAACASTEVSQVWRDKDRAPAPMGKTLVIAIAQRDSVRLALENEWVTQLKERGVEAHPSQTLLGNDGALDKQRVVNAVKANARRVARRLGQQSPILQEARRADRLKIVAARYDLDVGSVEWLEAL